jgi:hypothetical protein
MFVDLKKQIKISNIESYYAFRIKCIMEILENLKILT